MFVCLQSLCMHKLLFSAGDISSSLWLASLCCILTCDPIEDDVVTVGLAGDMFTIAKKTKYILRHFEVE